MVGPPGLSALSPGREVPPCASREDHGNATAVLQPHCPEDPFPPGVPPLIIAAHFPESRIIPDCGVQTINTVSSHSTTRWTRGIHVTALSVPILKGLQILGIMVTALALAFSAYTSAQRDSSETPGMPASPGEVRPWGSDASGTIYQGEPLAMDADVAAAEGTEDDSSDAPASMDEPQGWSDGPQGEEAVNGLVAYRDERVVFGALARSGDEELYLLSTDPQAGRLHALTNPRSDNSMTSIPTPPGVQPGPETGGEGDGGPQTGSGQEYTWKAVAHGRLYVLVPLKAGA